MTTTIKIGITFLIFFALGGQILAQTDAWFYLRARDTLFEPSFQKIKDEIRYTGSDSVLKDVLSKHKILVFKKTYRNATRANLKKTFFVITESDSLLNDLLSNASHLFEYGELIQEEDKKIFEPNDYGLTSTIGENIGAQVNLDYLDFLGLPQAWYYTTGSRDIIVGIADGAVDTTDIEFKEKTKVLKKSYLSKGHGMSVSETAAGQGDNGYGIPGICYDCSIYTTSYGQFKTFSQLVELSKAGARVINCSWGTTRFYETAQQAIYEMLDNGTIIVAAGHNRSFLKSKGELFYYPASYDKVIAVSSGMHKYEDYRENIIEAENQNGKYYYAKNVRWYVGANVGFIDNDTTQAPSRIFKRSMRNFNSEIDILAPSIGIFRYSELALHDKIDVSTGSQTSGVTPLITGTIGLMFSLYPCLPADEVESILKITSTNIDHIEANKPFVGIYGSGMLHTGRAVEMIYQLYAEKETAYIQDQEFARWDFKITSLSKEIRIRNQIFTDKATLKLTAKNRIVIGNNTVLRPGRQGSISLKIDPALEKQCELVLRDPSIE